ncbi:hypothetical protein [Aquipuribacter hungaricus]|uniref:GNAT family N-acetyltransferase n=1 Tax=Aquipuribacter hungaricus TaxID=545624 RepID=A0ABV7WI61_9MICO
MGPATGAPPPLPGFLSLRPAAADDVSAWLDAQEEPAGAVPPQGGRGLTLAG